jgi:predicted PurR-regulated permease PerM
MSNKYLPSLVCGFGAAVLTTVPGIKSFGFCLLVPCAAVLSLFLHQKVKRSNIEIDSGTAIVFGILTGLFAAIFATFFEVIITFFTHTNDFVESLPQSTQLARNFFGNVVDKMMSIFNKMSTDIQTKGFSLLYTLAIFISNGVIYLIFGLIGGLIGRSFINKRSTP